MTANDIPDKMITSKIRFQVNSLPGANWPIGSWPICCLVLSLLKVKITIYPKK